MAIPLGEENTPQAAISAEESQKTAGRPENNSPGGLNLVAANAGCGGQLPADYFRFTAFFAAFFAEPLDGAPAAALAAARFSSIAA